MAVWYLLEVSNLAPVLIIVRSVWICCIRHAQSSVSKLVSCTADLRRWQTNILRLTHSLSYINPTSNRIGKADDPDDCFQTLQADFNVVAYFETARFRSYWTANYLPSTNTRQFCSTVYN
jgi:hypothetical protein